MRANTRLVKSMLHRSNQTLCLLVCRISSWGLGCLSRAALIVIHREAQRRFGIRLVCRSKGVFSA